MNSFCATPIYLFLILFNITLFLVMSFISGWTGRIWGCWVTVTFLGDNSSLSIRSYCSIILFLTPRRFSVSNKLISTKKKKTFALCIASIYICIHTRIVNQVRSHGYLKFYYYVFKFHSWMPLFCTLVSFHYISNLFIPSFFIHLYLNLVYLYSSLIWLNLIADFKFQ